MRRVRHMRQLVASVKQPGISIIVAPLRTNSGLVFINRSLSFGYHSYKLNVYE